VTSATLERHIQGDLLRAVEACEREVVGQAETLRWLLVAVMAGGHALIEDAPGSGKTTLAKAVSSVLGGRLRRVQGTADLLPGDLTGSSIWNPESRTFEFIPGPVFADLLLVDEFNRMPPRTQAVLLEAMQERQVTVDGIEHRLSPTFTVLATQNPIDAGSFTTPLSVTDRFAVKISPQALTRADETDVVLRSAADPTHASTGVGAPLVSPTDLVAAARNVHVASHVAGYAVDVVARLRQHLGSEVTPSVRATTVLIKCAQGNALLEGRQFVTPGDVQDVAGRVLVHRASVSNGDEFWRALGGILDAVPVPIGE